MIAQEPASSSPVEWVQYGVLGLTVLALMLGWLWPKPAVDRLLAELDRLRQERHEHDETVLSELRVVRSELRSYHEAARRHDVPLRDTPSRDTTARDTAT